MIESIAIDQVIKISQIEFEIMAWRMRRYGKRVRTTLTGEWQQKPPINMYKEINIMLHIIILLLAVTALVIFDLESLIFNMFDHFLHSSLPLPLFSRSAPAVKYDFYLFVIQSLYDMLVILLKDLFFDSLCRLLSGYV